MPIPHIRPVPAVTSVPQFVTQSGTPATTEAWTPALPRPAAVARRTALRGTLLAGAALAVTALSGCAIGPRTVAADADRACRNDSAGERVPRLCVAGPVPAAAVEAEARLLRPDPQRLTVVVVRQRWADAANRVPLSVDGGAPIDTLPASFVRLRLAPGRHVLRASWGETGAPAAEQATELAISGQAGDLLCVDLVGSVWLWRTRYRLEPAAPAQAAERVRTLRLVADRG